MLNARDAFELLTILDSPLLDSQAPELIRYRAIVEEIVKPSHDTDCTSCQKRTIFGKLAAVQTKLQDEINQNPALVAQVPTLLASAKMRQP